MDLIFGFNTQQLFEISQNIPCNISKQIVDLWYHFAVILVQRKMIFGKQSENMSGSNPSLFHEFTFRLDTMELGSI